MSGASPLHITTLEQPLQASSPAIRILIPKSSQIIEQIEQSLAKDNGAWHLIVLPF